MSGGDLLLTTEKINGLLGIKESYQASDTLHSILFNKEKRETLLKKVLSLKLIAGCRLKDDGGKA